MAANVNPTKTIPSHSAEAEALFMSIGEGAIVTDTNARISRINQTALRILGYSEKEMIGKWFPEVIIAEDEQGTALSNIDRPMGQAFFNRPVSFGPDLLPAQRW